MKKNFFYLAVTLFMALFASCSQEEAPSTLGSKSKLVSISAQLPTEGVKTRALPTANDHDLRCILEIWSTGNNPELMYRDEKLDLDAVDNKISFEFALEPGNYKFLMWADFVATGTGQVNGHYADKFYDTNDLKNITLKDASLLYNTDACDAFFAAQEFTKTEDVESFDATLKRPFAKIIVSEKNKTNFEKCAKVSVSHKVPQGFNVEDGSVSTTLIPATLSEAAALGKGNTDLKLFSYYVFAAPADDALGEIKLTFKDVSDTELRSTAIPAGVSVIRNRCTQAKGHLVAEATNNGKVDVGFDDEWTSNEENIEPTDPTLAMEVGDYYYSDGTWSATLNGEKTCIGVVYAVDAQNGEKASDYDGDYARIKGYVMALESTARLEFCSKEMYGTIDFTDLELNKKGNKNTKDIFADNRYTQYSDKFPVLEAFITFKEQTMVPSNSSGWYIPSIEQLIDMTTSYFGEGENAKNDKFATAVDAIEGANLFVNSTTTGRYLLSSSITNSGLHVILLTGSVLSTSQKVQAILNSNKAGVQGQIRPILTVLE
ncbi:hypothetical protein PQG98_13745 [Bacteroides zhangwenhongii]|jgi:hypothetical protein|uniref:DUF6562 domain-containing protein n=1 Tax=Bacteroides zhangwenhongii TaxID=2650157 RepID=A0ABT5HBQ4_9BACE|nr:DUF6562 domain-containing protein [Bacteroides zhangwenhongii]MDC7137391.1 hypothetical protein [Bacteroides zhangwenhongii]